MLRLPAYGRWLLAPLASIGACSGSMEIGDALGAGVARVVTPVRLEAVFPTDWRTGVVLALAAGSFVVAGAFVVPKWRLAAAVALFALGAWVADMDLRLWWFPEGHPRAYQTSHVPLTLTLIGGIVGVLAVTIYAMHSRQRRT